MSPPPPPPPPPLNLQNSIDLIKSKDSDDDEHVKKVRELRKKAEDEGKKEGGPPTETDTEWSCGTF